MNTPEQHIITSLLEKHALGICTPEESALLENGMLLFRKRHPCGAMLQKKQL